MTTSKIYFQTDTQTVTASFQTINILETNNIITPQELVKTYLFQILIMNSQKGAYGSLPQQHITQLMETLLTTLYTHSFAGFCIYVKFQLIDSYNSVLHYYKLFFMSQTNSVILVTQFISY